MGPSSDLSQLSLEQAATLIATRVKVARVHGIGEKQAMSHGLTGAILGGGLGLGTGLMSSAMSQDRRKRWLRNALLGASLGAGVGGAAGYGYNMLKDISKPSPLEDATNKAEAAQAAAAASKPNPDAGSALIGDIYNAGADWLSGANTADAPAATSAASPTIPPPPPQATRIDAAGNPIVQHADKVLSLPDKLRAVSKDYTVRPGTAALSTGVGAAAGGLAGNQGSKALEAIRQRRVTPYGVQNLDDSVMEALNAKNKVPVEEFQQAMHNANAEGRIVSTPFFGAPESGVPTGAKRVAHEFTPQATLPGAGPGAPLRSNLIVENVTKQTPLVPPGTWHNSIVPAVRDARAKVQKLNPTSHWKPTIGGAGVGAGLGLLATPAADHLINNARGWWDGTSE